MTVAKPRGVGCEREPCFKSQKYARMNPWRAQPSKFTVCGAGAVLNKKKKHVHICVHESSEVCSLPVARSIFRGWVDI